MADIIQTVARLKEELSQALAAANSHQAVEDIRIAFMGRNGHMAHLMNTLKNLSVEEKRIHGPALNECKQFIEQALAEKERALQAQSLAQETARTQHFDVTANLYQPLRGSLHVYTHVIEQLQDIFISMGYAIADGPEVETEHYNFEALNVPAHHPARDMQDTFWLDIPGFLMRTQTSNMQIHAMEEQSLPLALFAPGRVYRSEATDASHDFMFTQAECLFIDKHVSMAHLLATAQTFLQTFFDKKDLQIRVRPGYFPFVEPGVEIDASCPFCKNGCSICKKTTWIELLGAGLVHPNVLKYCGIDSTVYTGFAFGTGIERLAMIKYGIHDIRLFHSENVRFLTQF